MGAKKTLKRSITQVDPKAGVYWRYARDSSPRFDVDVFDEEKLRAQGKITGLAGAGRGNTFFLTLNEQPLVLRHYRRGGLIRKITAARYCYTGLSRTRAIREYELLTLLKEKQLPAPIPYACRVEVNGYSYQASLVTHWLAGLTLAEHLQRGDSLEENLWAAVGQSIATFHAQGVFHADLNAHNIMIDESGLVSLIDFDRARFRTVPNSLDSGWCKQNIKRLERSLDKLAKQAGAESGDAFQQTLKDGFQILEKNWATKLSNDMAQH